MSDADYSREYQDEYQRLKDAQAAGFKLVCERFRDEDPYSRGSRIVGVVWRN